MFVCLFADYVLFSLSVIFDLWFRLNSLKKNGDNKLKKCDKSQQKVTYVSFFKTFWDFCIMYNKLSNDTFEN